MELYNQDLESSLDEWDALEPAPLAPVELSELQTRMLARINAALDPYRIYDQDVIKRGQAVGIAVFESWAEARKVWERSLQWLELLREAIELLPRKCAVRNKDPHQFAQDRMYFHELNGFFKHTKLLMFTFQNGVDLPDDKKKCAWLAIRDFMRSGFFDAFDRIRVRVYQQTRQDELKYGVAYKQKRKDYDAGRKDVRRSDYAASMQDPLKKQARKAYLARKHTERKLKEAGL
jgi:hypothetical protein